MLHELTVENLLLLERAELRLAPGLNVLTGETGAGKTILAHALDLLLGGSARGATVRQGAAEAYIEGVFALPQELAQALGDRLPDGAQELVLARRVWPDGRTRAYVAGRAATIADLRELGGRLVSFYGQHEHRRLTLGAAQLEILDAYCGSAQAERRRLMEALHARVRELLAAVRELRELAGARERELDLLAYEIGEIDAAAPDPAQDGELTRERERLRSSEALQAAAAHGAEAISGHAEAGGGAADLMAAAARRIEPAAAADPELAALSQRLTTLSLEAADVGAELGRYALAIEAVPGRLEEVEERLSQLARLERKYGGDIGAVLAHAEDCRRRRAELEGAESSLAEAEAELELATARRDELAAELRTARERAAPALAQAVRERLSTLAMPDARFSVELRPREGGCGLRGADSVELLIAPNAGVPATLLRETASGGELSRVMLALLSAAGERDDEADVRGERSPLLVFDEIDAGIGGHTARAVGEHLRSLAEGRQLLCITHLPQVASQAERHFRIEKSTTGGTTTTTVSQLSGDAVVGELVRMLGASEDDEAASRHARGLLSAA